MRVYVPFGAQWHGYFVRRLAERLGIEDHIVFYDRFVTDQELQEFLEADVIGIPKPHTYRPTAEDE